MKKLLITLLAISVVAGIVNAQTTKNNIGYFGLQHSTRVGDGEKKLILCVGYGGHLKGDLWILNTGQIASRGYVSLEPSLAYVVGIAGTEGKARLRGALHAGPSADWVNTEGVGPWLLYVPGAIGATLFGELPSFWGAAFSIRQKFTLKDSTQYQDGWILNINITKRW